MAEPRRYTHSMGDRLSGARLPPNTKKVTRPSRFGNEVSRPGVQGDPGSHRAAVAFYRRWFFHPHQAAFRELVREELKGYNLACACPQGCDCHADVLLSYANEDGEW